MNDLSPRLLVSTGAPCTGKSTILEELTRRIPNAIYLDRDTINEGILYVDENAGKELLPFRDYVSRDDVFSEAVFEDTIFGKMLKIQPKNSYHRRHARDQSHLVQSLIARENLKLGKVPIVNCFGIRQIREKIPQRFMDQPAFAQYPRYMIHFAVLDDEEYFKRVTERAKRDESASIRDKEILTSKESFKEALEKRHGKMVPDELSDYDYFLLDTSNKSLGDCVSACLNYISV